MFVVAVVVSLILLKPWRSMMPTKQKRKFEYFKCTQRERERTLELLSQISIIAHHKTCLQFFANLMNSLCQ